MSKFRTIIGWCLDSLETEPEAWSPRFIDVKLYYVSHRNGVTVWIANGYDSLAIYPDKQLIESQRVGGLTVLSLFVGWATPWRRGLMNAARRVAGTATAPKPIPAEDAVLTVIRGASAV